MTILVLSEAIVRSWPISPLQRCTILINKNRSLLKVTKAFVLSICPLFIFISTVHAIEIRIPTTSEYEARHSYKIGLLKLLLKKIPGNHQITTSSVTYTQSRAIYQLSEGKKDINLYWTGTSSVLEKELLPVYFPIYRGLMGYRFLIINKGDKDKFKGIKALSDLQQLQGIQGLGWSDKELLEYSGLKQYSAKYDNIFSMINKGRVNYFSRGIMEAYNEVAIRERTLPNLRVDENILLRYPFAMYFFTSPENKELAELLTKAFIQAYEDGSFLDYFNTHPEIKKAFEQLNNENRMIIDIPNPFLTEETMELPSKYWHQQLTP